MRNHVTCTLAGSELSPRTISGQFRFPKEMERLERSSIRGHKSEAVKTTGPRCVLEILYQAWLGSKTCPIVHPSQQILPSKSAARSPWRQSNDMVLHDDNCPSYLAIFTGIGYSIVLMLCCAAWEEGGGQLGWAELFPSEAIRIRTSLISPVEERCV